MSSVCPVLGERAFHAVEFHERTHKFSIPPTARQVHTTAHIGTPSLLVTLLCSALPVPASVLRSDTRARAKETDGLIHGWMSLSTRDDDPAVRRPPKGGLGSDHAALGQIAHSVSRLIQPNPSLPTKHPSSLPSVVPCALLSSLISSSFPLNLQPSVWSGVGQLG